MATKTLEILMSTRVQCVNACLVQNFNQIATEKKKEDTFLEWGNKKNTVSDSISFSPLFKHIHKPVYEDMFFEQVPCDCTLYTIGTDSIASLHAIYTYMYIYTYMQTYNYMNCM